MTPTPFSDGYVAHYVCYTECFNVAEAWRTRLGRNPPPACKDAAGAIGGM